jgi:multisubunit Na+/H+ antiporter MnhB subunit
VRLDRSLILTVCVSAVFPVALLFSLFLLFAGHNQPGGGFVGGLVAGAAFLLRYVDGGPVAVEEAARFRPNAYLGIGVATSVAAGMLGWVGGGQFLESGVHDLELGPLGTAHLGTTLVFDIGVYLVVVGLVLTVLRTLGAEDAP